jgi:hypothetical protein
MSENDPYIIVIISKKGLVLGKVQDQKDEDQKTYVNTQRKLERFQDFIKNQNQQLKRKKNSQKRREGEEDEDSVKPDRTCGP